MVDAQDLGQGDLSEIPPGEHRLFQDRVALGKEGGPHEHPEDAPDGIPSALSQGPRRGPGTVTEQSPSQTENEPAQDVASQDCGFYGELDQAQIQEQIDTDHADQDARQHKFYDGHVQETERSDLFVVTDDPGLLQKETEEYAGHKTVKENFHP